MPWKRKHQRPSSRPGTRCCLPILAMLFLASCPILAQGSIEPKPRESQPASTRPERSYTEEEALAAAEAAARKAVDVAVPLAVQAAVAEERGKTAAQQLLDRADPRSADATGPKLARHGPHRDGRRHGKPGRRLAAARSMARQAAWWQLPYGGSPSSGRSAQALSRRLRTDSCNNRPHEGQAPKRGRFFDNERWQYH